MVWSLTRGILSERGQVGGLAKGDSLHWHRLELGQISRALSLVPLLHVRARGFVVIGVGVVVVG